MFSARLSLAVLFSVSPALAYFFGLGLGSERSIFRRDLNSTGDESNSTQWPTRTFSLVDVNRSGCNQKFFFPIAALANGGKSWASAFKKAKSTVAEMTVEELANVRLERIIRVIVLNEGNPRSPQGL